MFQFPSHLCVYLSFTALYIEQVILFLYFCILSKLHGQNCVDLCLCPLFYSTDFHTSTKTFSLISYLECFPILFGLLDLWDAEYISGGQKMNFVYVLKYYQFFENFMQHFLIIFSLPNSSEIHFPFPVHLTLYYPLFNTPTNTNL